MTENIPDRASDSEAPTIANVTVEGPGISINRTVSEATMASIIGLLFGTAPTLTQCTDDGADRSHRSEVYRQAINEEQPSIQAEDLTLGEFLDETEAKTFAQKICATGYYLIKIRNVESFSREDIKTSLANAHEDMPGNFPRDWTSAASSNLIAARQDDKDQFYIPRTGRTAVESHFQEPPRRRNTRRPTRKSNTKPNREESE
jgi:hypothetical protein